MSDKKNSGRLSVRINDDTCRAMERLVINDRNATEVVRRAIALLDLVQEQELAGKKLAFVDEKLKATEIVRIIY